MDEAALPRDAARAEYQLWHVYDAGGPTLRLKVRYHDEVEASNWREGPDLQEALDQAAAAGWYAYDREPGNVPDEYAIVHLKRDG